MMIENIVASTGVIATKGLKIDPGANANTAFVMFYGADKAGATVGVAAGSAAEDTAVGPVVLNSGCQVKYGGASAAAHGTPGVNYLNTILLL